MPGRYDRYRIDIDHVALRALSRESVNERLRWAGLDAPVVEAAAHATSCRRPFNGL